MKIFVSGPMRGHENYNRPLFEKARECIKREFLQPAWLKEVEVIIPHDLDGDDVKDKTPAEVYQDITLMAKFLSRNIEAIAQCTYVCLLPGWEKSGGARCEKEAALRLEVDLIFYDDKEDTIIWRDTPPDVLKVASEIVDGSRKTTYGHPVDNHERTAELWNAFLLGKDESYRITAQDVCIMNILQKVSRLAHSIHRDSLIDICGYARNIEIIEVEAEGFPPTDWA